ncbi:hypothetical protein FAM09_03240 [Niastella caeni]|uniref:DUF1440 domain-containing protein n=1 Tax=Niastella caeni TaxID=2569763 RepID=A0A4S8HZA2_9BACT|nr:hypothetical protein [Niastella caeni]THU41143.1 hypothetical protein FAM09_03240 [Niastella caeni]
MTTIQTARAQKQYYSKPILKTIAWVGLLVGTLDITAACTHAYLARGIAPVRVLRFIASGAFGKAAFEGVWLMPLLGLLFHYFIAYSFTALFFWLHPNVKLMSKNRVITAVVYCIFIYVVMNMLVLPLTKIPAITFNLEKAIIATLILIVAIGLPLSFIASKFFQDRNAK